MRDAHVIRILLFDGHPHLHRLGSIQVGGEPRGLLRLALQSEVAAVGQFDASAKE